nr:hypothetical protein [Tanacetum cinerariifolium]
LFELSSAILGIILSTSLSIGVNGEGSTISVESHHTSLGAPKTSQPLHSSPSRIPTRQETEVPQPSSPTHTHVADEAASTGLKKTKQVCRATYTKLITKVKRLEKIVKSSQVRRRAKLVVSDDEELEDPSKQGRSMIEEIDQD